MFCYQCEQTAKGTGCTAHGVCGKDPRVAGLQDLLVHACKGLSQVAHAARQAGVKDREADVFVIQALFSTLTNVNFNPADFEKSIRKAVSLREKIRKEYEAACKANGKTPEAFTGPAAWQPAADSAGLDKQAAEVGVEQRRKKYGEDVAGLQELIMYGLKGMASYTDHAQILGKEDDAVYAFFHETLDWLAQGPADVNALLGKALKVGEVNLTVMGLLDAANTGAYGHPEPTHVRITPVKGKAILISGHDLKDLDELLKQTEGKGINIYTHGEMLPCNAYPELKKHEHLIGNYGGAWQDQQKEFAQFPGAILMTTNCLMKPQQAYEGRLFTSGVAGWPGIPHIADRNFAPVIAAAQAAEGFKEDEPEKTITIGFAHNTVMSVAGKVIEAVKGGAIKHFFLIGGCDGAKPGRNYYTDFAQAVPKDCVILTLACGKYRFNKLDFGDIGGIPRLLDCGQCNDSYSAIQIAVALANAFNCGVNDLPLSLILSWYEQKACVILLTLLHLGIKNMKLGPTLPAFLTPPVLNVLVEKFNIAPVTTPKEDLAAILK
jgi:hydroxylamine reductase